MQPILVAYDGSPESRSAANIARQLAFRTGWQVILLHVLDPRDGLWDLTRDQVQLREQVHRELLAEEAASFVTPVQTRILPGAAAEVVATEAARASAGLVIVGTHGRSAVGRALLGSVALQVLTEVERPILVAHRDARPLRGVVAGVDDHAGADAVVSAARSLAGAVEAELTLAHVMTTDRSIAARPESFGIPAAAWADALAATANRVFGPHRAAAAPAHEELLFGWAPDQLRECAVRTGSQVVVVGRRGGSGRGIHHVWSVGTALATRGPFSTLVVPS